MITKNKKTITLKAIADKKETETAIERDIIKEIYNHIWNVSEQDVKVEEVDNEQI